MAHSNPEKKQSKHKRNTSGLIPFKKGYDPRRNTKGRPKSFDELRTLAQDIAEATATNKGGKPLEWNGQEVTFAEYILLTFASDKKLMKDFLEFAYGKVPQAVTVEGDQDKPIKVVVEYADTDGNQADPS